MTEYYFNCVTQYSKEFEEIITDNMKDKNFCAFFSLITAKRFLIGEELNKFIHEGNIARAITSHILCNINKQMSFDELIRFTDLDAKNIIGTTTELVANDIIGYKNMFPETKEKYAVIFLKNGKFFVVLAENGKYYLRDCHESTQYNLLTLAQLNKYLNEIYQFDHTINIGGYCIEEYSNIEFIVIEKPFKTIFDHNITFPLINKLENIENEDENEIIEDYDYDLAEYEDEVIKVNLIDLYGKYVNLDNI